MNPESEGRAMAKSFRDRWRLGTQPLGDLVTIIEQLARIDVAVLEAGPDEHGLTMRDPARGTVFIGVARSRRPMRQRSTLAHELGHVLFEDWADGDADGRFERAPQESRADAFARHLLVPVDGLRDFLGPPGTTAQVHLSAVVQRFLVSPAIAAIALRDAGYVDERTKAEWRSLTTPQLAASYGWSDLYQALQTDSDQRRAPQRLLARAIRGYAEGVLAAQAIATLRGVPVRVVEADLREAGIVPAEPAIVWAEHTDLPEADVDLTSLDRDLGGRFDDIDDAAAHGDAL